MSKSDGLEEECTVSGNNGGADDFEASSVGPVGVFVMRLLIIFSSMSALTLTLAV